MKRVGENEKLTEMKKIIVLVCSALMVFNAAFSQNVTDESVRAALANGMVNFVGSVRPFYLKGQDQQKFITAVCGTWKPTPEGTAVLAKAYEFLSKGTSNATIASTYNGKEMAGVVKYLKRLYDVNPKVDGAEIFGGKNTVLNNPLARAAECKWYQLWCHLRNFAQWIVDNWGVIQQIIDKLAPLLM